MEREMKEKIFHLSQILHCYHTNDSLTQAKTDTCMYTHKHTNTHTCTLTNMQNGLYMCMTFPNTHIDIYTQRHSHMPSDCVDKRNLHVCMIPTFSAFQF